MVLIWELIWEMVLRFLPAAEGARVCFWVRKRTSPGGGSMVVRGERFDVWQGPVATQLDLEKWYVVSLLMLMVVVVVVSYSWRRKEAR